MLKHLARNLERLQNELSAKRLAPSKACALFVLSHLQVRHGSKWLSGPRQRMGHGTVSVAECAGWLEEWNIEVTPGLRRRLGCAGSVHELFAGFFFRGVVLDSHEGMVGWLEQRYPLELRSDIPTPDELLALQCAGRRVVTLLLEPERQMQRLGRHQDACAFLLHDLEHAHKFFGARDGFLGQVRFFRSLNSVLPHFDLWRMDERFVADLDYLKADMNSHPVHLIKYLKAVVLSAEMRRTGTRQPALDDFWNELLRAWNMPVNVQHAALRLNQPGQESVADQVAVRDFFMFSEESHDRDIISNFCLS